jgi:hypothetical protein
MTIGVLIPFVCRQEIAGAEPVKNAIVTFEDDWEEAIDEEKTIKLSPWLRRRPIWEQKTTPLPQGL